MNCLIILGFICLIFVLASIPVIILEYKEKIDTERYIRRKNFLKTHTNYFEHGGKLCKKQQMRARRLMAGHTTFNREHGGSSPLGRTKTDKIRKSSFPFGAL